MAEGGIATKPWGTPEDKWAGQLREPMRGGKMLNNWRMAQLHAMESPDRVLELEEWGALFDRTKDGLILQRDFGGHRYARLAHVGDRTGLELIRTLQQRVVHLDLDVHMECNIQRLLKDGNRVCGAFGYWRPSGVRPVQVKAVVLATGASARPGIHVELIRVQATASRRVDAGADTIDMECIGSIRPGWSGHQRPWHPHHGGRRGDGGTLKNSDGVRFMFNYIQILQVRDRRRRKEADATQRRQRTTVARRTCW
jgi:succinate dehydrogenase / fumarate reductase flavoprotein subunit